ncbi:MAG TPA: hypothetical protein VF538_16850 [Pyrinomonadaceae bacterium]|jgi:hypothetical protein
MFQKLERVINSPLGAIGLELEAQLRAVRDSVAAGAHDPGLLKYVVSKTEAVIEILPRNFGDRFWFDAEMIESIKKSWSHQGQRLSDTIIPNYGPEWSHARDNIPSTPRSGQGKSINVVYIPGEDALDDIDLLTYPFMCHELGHNLFFYNDSLFVGCFEDVLRKVVGSLRLRGLPDKGAAALRAGRVIDEMQELWFPGLNHRNWAHETGMDMIAIWTCGPAYLAVFQDTIQEGAKDPYLITQEHPPYAVRVEALIKAAEQLGWSDYTRGLKRVVKEWRRSRWSTGLTNRYVALADSRLVDACVSCALDACEKLSLPKCDVKEIERVRGMVRRGGVPAFGTELILAAWLVEQQEGENGFELWERATVRKLVDSITQ